MGAGVVGIGVGAGERVGGEVKVGEGEEVGCIKGARFEY